MLVYVTVIFRNLIFVCITIKDKLIKHLYNSHLRKLPIAHGEVSVMVCSNDPGHTTKSAAKIIYLYLHSPSMSLDEPILDRRGSYTHERHSFMRRYALATS